LKARANDGDALPPAAVDGMEPTAFKTPGVTATVANTSNELDNRIDSTQKVPGIKASGAKAIDEDTDTASDGKAHSKVGHASALIGAEMPKQLGVENPENIGSVVNEEATKVSSDTTTTQPSSPGPGATRFSSTVKDTVATATPSYKNIDASGPTSETVETPASDHQVSKTDIASKSSGPTTVPLPPGGPAVDSFDAEATPPGKSDDISDPAVGDGSNPVSDPPPLFYDRYQPLSQEFVQHLCFQDALQVSYFDPARQD